MSSSRASATGVAAGRVAGGPTPGPEHRALAGFIGKWINEGQTLAGPGTPSAKIRTSDVYEWVPGGFFILHTAYGRIGDIDVGAVELIGYDAARGAYQTHLFDSQGNISPHTLTVEGGVWHWQGERTRCTAVFRDGGRTQVARHERTDDHLTWVPSMDVTLTRVQ